MDRATYEKQRASRVNLSTTAMSMPGPTGGMQTGDLALGFGVRRNGDISETIAAATGSNNYYVEMGGETVTRGGNSILENAVNGTKRRMVTDLNINLKSADVSAQLQVVRQNANGSPTVSSGVALKRFNSMGAFQENKYTLKSEIFLDDGDSLRLIVNNGSGASVDIDVDGTYEILG